MPRNGSGVYSKPAGTTAAPNTTIESAKYNSTIDDLVSDANTARPIVAGGTGATSASAARTGLGFAADAGNFGKQGANIASASTTDLSTATGDYVFVTGTTTITALGTATAGVERTVQFTGALTLTHNATSLILPGGANITTAAGDVAVFKSEGSGNWRCVSYQRAAIAPSVTAFTFSQFRLTKSGSNLRVSREGGKYITINGVNEIIPSGGVDLSPSGSSAGTTYNIYAYMSSGTMTLEYSTTAHATDSTTGVEIKSGDATRTLVGMARAVTGPAWADTVTQRFVISWANRKTKGITNVFTANRTRATGSGVGEINTEIRCEFLTWADEIVAATANAMVSNDSGSGISIYSGFLVDGTLDSDAFIDGQTAATNYRDVTSFSIAKAMSEGYHYLSITGGTSAGTATWYGDTSGGRRTHIAGSIIG